MPSMEILKQTEIVFYTYSPKLCYQRCLARKIRHSILFDDFINKVYKEITNADI